MLEDKIVGMFYGVFLGDALGAPYEFKKGKSKFVDFTGLLDKSIIQCNKYQGIKKSVIGQFTDDSEMTLALLTSLVNNKGYNKEEVISSYIEWANSKCPFMGKNTRELFHGIKTLKGYNSRYEKKVQLPKQEWSQSNGCLMRASPLALLDDLKYSIIDCSLTNPHPICTEVVMLYVRLLKNILIGRKIHDCIDDILNNTKNNDILNVINEGLSKSSRDININKGWILHAFYCVFYCLACDHTTYSSAINDIIKLGGDTDTNACIVGAVIGAIHGYNNMSKETLTKKNIEIMTNSDPEKGDIKRYNRYNFDGINKMIKNAIIIFNE